mmetsp:Transcript_90098/g.259754  ORF Transcript_90098/g.259754 Transcript_90098/m.259754 type:complete len:540 (-) Transcript_90098:243-1862(-)
MEEGRHLPVVSKAWDKNGVKAFRALRDCSGNPMKILSLSSEARDAEGKEFIDDLDKTYQECNDIMGKNDAEAQGLSDPNAGKPVRDDIEKAEKTDKSRAMKLLKLTRIYEAIEKCSQIRAMSALQRVRGEGDLPEGFKTPFWWKLWYVASPCVLFMGAFMVQSFLLHIATHLYVRYMFEEEKFREPGHTRLYDVIGSYFGELGGGTTTGMTTTGKIHVPPVLLDASGAIPLGLCVLAFMYSLKRNTFSIGLWNKTFLIASIMAITKGVFDVVTIMPDSSGWKTCKTRLGQNQDELKDMDFDDSILEGLQDLIVLELMGENGKRVRYCADMMVSGHTYFASLFGLSAYKQIYYAGVHRWAANLVLLVCSLCVVAEVVMVAAARFHYTVDMLAAILLVILLFDSTYIEQVASFWSEGFWWRNPDTQSFQPRWSISYRIYRLFRYCYDCRRNNSTSGGHQKLPSHNAEDIGAEDIVASRATGLLDMRSVLGHEPWKRMSLKDLERKTNLGYEVTGDKPPGSLWPSCLSLPSRLSRPSHHGGR